MIKLYDSAFSPFARKVRMVLEHKGLEYEAVDGLLRSNHQALKAVNGRLEVPTLVDGDIVVVNSADIVAFLDDRYPQIQIYPEQPAARMHARAWERTADIFVDPILINVSYWKWAERPDNTARAARGGTSRPSAHLRCAGSGIGSPGVRQRAALGRRHRVVSAFGECESHGGAVYSAAISKSRPLVQANAITAHLPRRLEAGSGFCCGHRGPGFRAAPDLLARRSD